MSSYDFDLALARHAMWMTRLKLFTMGVGEEDLTPEKAADSSICELGAWIAEAGNQYQSLPGFAQLVEAHRHFHEKAGEIVRLHRAGDETEISMLLEEVLPQASENVSLALQKLRSSQS